MYLWRKYYKEREEKVKFINGKWRNRCWEQSNMGRCHSLQLHRCHFSGFWTLPSLPRQGKPCSFLFMIFFFPTILTVLLFMILMMIFGNFFEYWFVYRSVVFEEKEPEISLWSLAKDQRRYISSSFFCEHLKIHKILSFNKLNLNVS